MSSGNSGSGAIENQTLVSIFSSISRQETMLENLGKDVGEIKEDVKEIKRDYPPRTEVNLKFESLTATLSALQTKVDGLLVWQLQETQKHGDVQTNVNDRIAQTQLSSTNAITTHRVEVLWWIIGIAGSVILALLGVLIWLLEFYVSHH